MRTTMRAVVLRGYGSNDQVEVEEVDRPEPAPGELLVRIRAAGVNPIDWKIRAGAGERLGMSLPIRMGGELVGIVERTGEGFEAGETVFGMVDNGGFAEFAAVRAVNMVRVPISLNAMEAAALPLAGTTAWQAIFGSAGLTAGQRLLITNSSGGVGSLAVQFAKARGAHITAVASTRNAAFVRGLGADEVIDYTVGPFEEYATNMDVVLDTVGGDTFQRAFRTLKKGGVMVTVVAFPADEARRYGVQVKRLFAVPSAADLSAVSDLVSAGKVKPRVGTVLPLGEVKEALALSESGHAQGKIVLDPCA